jgi:21S rRNA (uridine2791-2'-O)-methyltransferase
VIWFDLLRASNSQVAVQRTHGGLIIGIDLIPAQPPRGVNTIQGDFLSPVIRSLVKKFVHDAHSRKQLTEPEVPTEPGETTERPSYIDMERHLSQDQPEVNDSSPSRVVDVSLTPAPDISGLKTDRLVMRRRLF